MGNFVGCNFACGGDAKSLHDEMLIEECLAYSLQPEAAPLKASLAPEGENSEEHPVQLHTMEFTNEGGVQTVGGKKAK